MREMNKLVVMSGRKLADEFVRNVSQGSAGREFPQRWPHENQMAF